MVSGWGSGDEQPLDLRRYFKELGVGHEGKRGSQGDTQLLGYWVGGYKVELPDWHCHLLGK